MAGWKGEASRARIERYKCSLQACSFLSKGWGLTDLPLRASNEDSPYRARSASKKNGLTCSLHILLRPRVARAQKIIRLHPLLCSASKKGTWPSVSRTYIARLASNPYLFHPSRLAGRSSIRLRASNEGLPRPRVPRAQRSPLRPAPPLLPSRHVISLLNQTPHDCIGVGRVRLQRLIGATY